MRIGKLDKQSLFAIRKELVVAANVSHANLCSLYGVFLRYPVTLLTLNLPEWPASEILLSIVCRNLARIVVSEDGGNESLKHLRYYFNVS